MALDIGNLLKRSVSGIVYIALIIGAVLWGPVGVLILSCLFSLAAVYEIDGLILKNTSGRWRKYWIIDTLAIIFLLLFFFFSAIDSIGLIFLFLLILTFLYRVCVQLFGNDKNPVKEIATSSFSFLYMSIPFVCFILLSYTLSPWVLLAQISLIWINDTGAYLIGCTLGRHRLYEAVSPKKSWEGFIGGIVFCVGASVGYYFCTKNLMPVSVFGWIVTGISVSVIATIGDLFESMIKRSIGVKDSGKLIPGHGGILDRIDSLSFVLPLLFILTIVFWA